MGFLGGLTFDCVFFPSVPSELSTKKIKWHLLHVSHLIFFPFIPIWPFGSISQKACTQRIFVCILFLRRHCCSFLRILNSNVVLLVGFGLLLPWNHWWRMENSKNVGVAIDNSGLDWIRKKVDIFQNTKKLMIFFSKK